MSKKLEETMAHLFCQFLKVDRTIVPDFLSLVSKIEICLKYFMNNKIPKIAIVFHLKDSNSKI